MTRQLQAHQAGEVALVDAPDAALGPGEVRLAVSHCGICGSDLHWFNGRGLLPAFCPGHEMSATVGECGDGVQGWAQGDRVAVEPLARCCTCARCLGGDYHLCSNARLFGIHLPGGMADSLVVPAYCLHRLPVQLSSELGALAEPLAVGVHAARLGAVGPGSRVLILGGGAVGLLAAVAAQELGADRVTITARYDHQKELAGLIGCDRVLAPDEVYHLDHQPSVVIETVGGSATTVADAVAVLEPGGRIIMVGLFEQTPSFSPLIAVIKEVHIVASMVYNKTAEQSDFETALDILVKRREVLASLVTHRFPLDDAQEAFSAAADKSSGAVKVLLSP